MYVGVPTIIGAGGVEKIVEINLSKDEQIMFDKSVEAVNGLVKVCRELDETLG
jgi:malate dehydrogenase